jgi:hypothetical protein
MPFEWVPSTKFAGTTGVETMKLTCLGISYNCNLFVWAVNERKWFLVPCFDMLIAFWQRLELQMASGAPERLLASGCCCFTDRMLLQICIDHMMKIVLSRHSVEVLAWQPWPLPPWKWESHAAMTR